MRRNTATKIYLACLVSFYGHVLVGSSSEAHQPHWVWLHATPPSAFALQAPENKKNDWVWNTAYAAIDIGACAYVVHAIYYRYQEIGLEVATPIPRTRRALMWCAGWVVPPTLLTSLQDRSLFLIDSAGIVIQTLMYKTVAKLIVMCAHGDVFDLAQQAIIKGKYLMKLLMS